MPGTEAAVLPKNIKPLHYQLELKPDIQNFAFSGNASIDVRVSESSSTTIVFFNTTLPKANRMI